MIIGIDPGLSGAIAVLDEQGVLREAFDMPVFKIKGKSQMDVYALGRLLAAVPKPNRAVIEQVGAMPGQGVTSMFNFGFSTGTVHGVLGAFQIPLTLVTPQRWKGYFRLGSDKDQSRQAAGRLWPTAAFFGRVKDAGRAEAALIARWSFDITPASLPDFME